MGGCQDPAGLNFAPKALRSGLGTRPFRESGGHSLTLGSGLRNMAHPGYLAYCLGWPYSRGSLLQWTPRPRHHSLPICHPFPCWNPFPS